MAKKPVRKYSDSDRNAARTAMPGTKRQTPATTTTHRSNSTGKVLGSTTMNRRGVAGGNPTKSASELKSRAKLYASGNLQSAKAPGSAKAALMRAKNIKGHEKATAKLKSTLNQEKVARQRKAKSTRK